MDKARRYDPQLRSYWGTHAEHDIENIIFEHVFGVFFIATAVLGVVWLVS